MHQWIKIDKCTTLEEVNGLCKSHLPLHTGVVYCYTNTMNGKSYIGQTISPIERHVAHISSCKNNSKRKDACTPFHLAIRKYGIGSFVYSILAFIVSNDEAELHKQLNDKEYLEIANHKSCDGKCGYNILIQSHDGVWHSHPNNIKVDQYSRFGDFVASYNSINHAIKITGCKNISNAIFKETYYANGFVFCKQGKKVPDKIFQRFRDMVIHQYSIEGDYIQTFDTLHDAANCVGGDKARIQSCTQSSTHIAYGHRWSHAKQLQLTLPPAQLDVPVYQYDLNGMFVAGYSNLCNAARAVNKKKFISY